MFDKLVKRYYYINSNYSNLLKKLERKKINYNEEKRKLEEILDIINLKIINQEVKELETYLIKLNNIYNILYKKNFQF